ncbi:myb-like protein D [Tribolium castaneum]|uniref:Uncharacterized protein n=1 Tax=Tribolium castaneum TaxID=7070 RepID=D6WNC1_TRICA|nr:PREDICTED: myb-like protein D [Tribolium castaneum]EFA03238.1 hypothetical protein TcasGA2_TC013170 [Tribolium castaneum]|eukprot:XP_001814071.1 PREDICTED: myb-like protein D [Tribolium castaneum]
MNFEYPKPDFTKDVSTDAPRNGLPTKPNGFYSRPRQFQDCSPLLRTAYSRNPYDKNPPNRNNSLNNNNSQHFNKPVYNRLGQRNNSYTKTNPSCDTQDGEKNNSPRKYSNKRPNEGWSGSGGPKRKWTDKRTPYYQNVNTTNNLNLAQNRMDRIRNNSLQEDEIVIHKNVVPETTVNLNDTQDIDATDITVEVFNPGAQISDDKCIERFKMILDPKTQAAIKTIQQKRKDKQVIFPFPVTPNVTGVSLHERFTNL